MLTLEASQADYSNRAGAVVIPLVAFTVYSVFPGTSTTYYWSTVPVHYNWNTDGDQYFKDYIKSISDITLSMQHLTLGANANQLGTPQLAIKLTAEIPIIPTTNLSFATVEYAELLVNPSRMMVAGSSAWWDLRDLTGDEHTYRFRGELIDATFVEDDYEVTLSFRTVIPRVPHVELLSQTENDPKDFGTILPIVYGQAKRVPCKNINAGWTTTLAEPLTADSTGVKKVTDATGFPTASTFDFLAGTEVVRCSASDHTNHTVTITTRGYDSSNAVLHAAGEIIIELLTEVVIGLAGHKCKEIQSLYIESPYTGDLVRFTGPALLYNEDSSAISGSSISTARIQQEDLLGFLLAVNASPDVTVQPQQRLTGDAAQTSNHAHPTDQTVETSESYAASRGTWSSVDTEQPDWNFNPTSGRSRLLCEFPGGVDNALNVLSWQIDCTITVSNIVGTCGLWIYPRDIVGFPTDRIDVIANANGSYSVSSNPSSPPEGTKLDALASGSYLWLYPKIDSYGSAPYPSFDIENLTMTATLDGATVGVERTIDVSITAASVGAGLRFYSDIDGYPVPYSFSDGYTFEDNETWLTTNCSSARSSAASPPQGTYSRLVTATGAGAVVTQITGLTSDVDLTTTDDRYRISLYCNDTSLLDTTIPIKVWFSNAAGSGTTPPAERYEIQVDASLLVSLSWVHLEFTAFDIAGSGAVTDIDTVGMSFTATAAVLIYFDDLRVADAANTNYTEVPGTLIENMAVIARHFIADHCGLGHTAIGTSLKRTADSGTAEGYLDDNVYAGAVTVYGYTFEEILGGMAYEGRGNIVREEASTGSVYEYLAADQSGATYVYAASVRTIDEWNRLTAGQRLRSQVATRFRSFWGYDPSLVSGPSAFTQTSRADRIVDDTDLTTTPFLAAYLRMGERDSPPMPFHLIQDEATAEEVLGWYAHESLRNTSPIFTLVVPFWLAFDLQRGDIVSVSPSWGGTFKCRVLSISRSLGVPAVHLTIANVS